MSPLKQSQVETIMRRLAFARVELEDLKGFREMSSENYRQIAPNAAMSNELSKTWLTLQLILPK